MNDDKLDSPSAIKTFLADADKVEFSVSKAGSTTKKLFERAYHVNAVDVVTQCQVVVSVERISENYLLYLKTDTSI